MLLCVNARRNRLRVPSSLDLWSEIDLIASRRVQRNGLSLRFHDKSVTLVLDWPGDGVGLWSNGKSRLEELANGYG